MNSEQITVVSGVPRSGTSMMMRMLEAGGLNPLTDRIRAPDENNPKGYYELECVKTLPHDHSWLPGARGRVTKIISSLLKHLPPTYDYKIVFMRRHTSEILLSQTEMLRRLGKNHQAAPDEELTRIYEKHLTDIQLWLQKQPNMAVHYVFYNDIIEDPVKHVAEINGFLGDCLDEVRMLDAVDTSLHRAKSA